MSKNPPAHKAQPTPSSPTTTDGWYAQFTAQAEQERAQEESPDFDPDVLAQAARGSVATVRGTAEIAQALESEEADAAFLDALTRRADTLTALRAQAPSDLKTWSVLSPADKQLIADVRAWLRNRVERVHTAAQGLKQPEAAHKFGRPSRLGSSARALRKSLGDFRLAATANQALFQKARLKPADLTALDALDKELQRVQSSKSENQSEHGDVKEQFRLHALALQDQLLDLRVRAMAALEKRPNLLKKVLETFPRLPERRASKKGDTQDGAGQTGDKSGSSGGGDASAGQTGGSTPPKA